MSHKMAVVWRWIVGMEVWAIVVAWWDANHLPQHVTAANAGPLAALAELTAALSWHGVIMVGGLLAQYGLLICGPLWVVSEIVAFVVSGRQREKAADLRADQYVEGQKHGWIPRGSE